MRALTYFRPAPTHLHSVNALTPCNVPTHPPTQVPHDAEEAVLTDMPEGERGDDWYDESDDDERMGGPGVECRSQ